MTREEKIIATAFTGKMFIDGSDMGLLYEYMEKKVGHGVIDIMLADKAFWEELHRACEQDFIDMVSKEQPSLPSDLDEAAEKHFENMEVLEHENIFDETHNRIFRAGAEWQKEQMLKDAAEGVVHYFGETQGVPRSITIPQMQKWLKPFGNGDKVKIIIVKED